MPTILLTNHYPPSVLNIVNKEVPNGFNLITLDQASKSELIKHASEAEYFLASGRLRIDSDVLNVAPKLRMIQRTGVGIDTLDLDVLRKKNIPVYVNKGVNSGSVAEHTIMLILSVLRKLPFVDSSVKKGIWRKQETGVQCNELYDKSVGIIGLGNIGCSVARLLQPFGVKILYYDIFRISQKEEDELNLIYKPLSEILIEVDILSLHLPTTKANKKMIGKNEIASMKSGSIIINTSRGTLIDQDALVDALHRGHLRGAGIDVFAEEPIPQDSSLLSAENVVLTPHIAGVTMDAFQRMMRKAFKNIRLFDEGKLEKIEEKKLNM